ncbi:related to increased rDNA silencing protein IRS4 [Fusarium torulosum]|uniref:Related to increased rDNA silencing protein IRS4 n=1 Tax=Fusarium torulosum TaxID=33205 RepID=A0AAE8M2Q2_9HYPO|nr:related to increased rDNA silencing protein IRS4 [Fusarium torulosum]
MPPVAAHTTGSSDAAAALRGATLAFNKKKPVPPPPPKDNGALTAAASAGRPRSPTKRLGTQSTGGSTIDNEQYSQSQNGGSIAARLRQLGSSPGQLHPSVAAGRTDPKSASFIAATLAASRSASPSPKARTPRRRTSIGGSSSSGEIVDSGSIPPTGSLISMFEQSRTGDPVKRSTPKRTPVKATKEQVDSISEERMSYLQDIPSLELKPKPKPKPKPRPLTPGPQTPSKPPPELLSPKPTRPPKPVLRPKTPPQIITRHATHYLSTPSPDPQKRSPKPVVQEKQRPPTPPQPRGASKPKVESKSVLQDRPMTITQKRVAPQLEPRLSRRRPSPPTPTEARPTSVLTMSSDDTFVSASSVQSPVRESPPPLLRRHFTGSNPPSPTRDFRHGHIKSSSVSSLPLESLTSAIVAGSLASARLTPHNTGGSLAPPLPRRQKSPRLMQTLRQPPKPTEEDADRHKKKGLKLHKGKHAHHEGSRKKWRDEVTPRERKRYEAVWASNRGLLLDMPNAPYEAMNVDSSEYVLNTVVREIWKRSRLPADELAEVWDLVDRKGQGVLGRAEFVVGMWLIDQRLRGRKIPTKVSASVWGSANGLKVDNKRHGHKH